MVTRAKGRRWLAPRRENMSNLVPRWTLDMRRRSNKDLEEEANKRSNLLRIQCWNEALNAYGTSYIFQRRARSWTSRVQWITYIGFVVPMIVGLLVLAYGHLKSLPVIIAVAAA